VQGKGRTWWAAGQSPSLARVTVKACIVAASRMRWVWPSVAQRDDDHLPQPPLLPNSAFDPALLQFRWPGAHTVIGSSATLREVRRVSPSQIKCAADHDGEAGIDRRTSECSFGTCRPHRSSALDQESRMSVDLVIFRRLACGDMVRKALQGQGNLQPLAHDKRIELLLARLSEAEDAQRNSVQVQHPDHQEFARSPERR
jgi:hypothetical protein